MANTQNNDTETHISPLKLVALNEYWSYNEGKRHFNIKLYEEILIAKQKINGKI